MPYFPGSFGIFPDACKHSTPDKQNCKPFYLIASNTGEWQYSTSVALRKTVVTGLEM